MATNGKIFEKILALCERLSVLETRQKDILDEIQTIRANELPHIDKRLVRLERTVWIAVGALTLAVFIIEMYVRLK